MKLSIDIAAISIANASMEYEDKIDIPKILATAVQATAIEKATKKNWMFFKPETLNI